LASLLEYFNLQPFAFPPLLLPQLQHYYHSEEREFHQFATRCPTAGALRFCLRVLEADVAAAVAIAEENNEMRRAVNENTPTKKPKLDTNIYFRASSIKNLEQAVGLFGLDYLKDQLLYHLQVPEGPAVSLSRETGIFIFCLYI
jgi:formate dehydrogenase maturation protein FdhE